MMLIMARQGINWSGSPLELYPKTRKHGPNTRMGPWPKTSSVFGNELRRIAPQLRLHGLSIDFGRKGVERIVTLKSEPVATSQTSVNMPPTEQSRLSR
jgi:hypothetical protein